MNDTSLLVDTVSAVMRLEEMRAQVAARNIAMANVPGASVERFDSSFQFEKLRAAVQDASQLSSEVALMNSLGEGDYLQKGEQSQMISLDAHVLELSSASTRYQALSEGVSRQFALMRLAIGGGK